MTASKKKKGGAHGLALTHFDFDIDVHGVATVLMDVQGDKMNTLSRRVQDDLETIIDKLETDDTIKAVVFGSAKPTSFIAGADIRVLVEMHSAADATQLARGLQQGYARIEALHTKQGKPVVAAIHGPALGGGLELALACSMRIVSDSPKTVLGVPEVKIGVFPGAGGTQRLPRLIGIMNGLDAILTGKNIRAKKAVKIGLADEMVPESVLLDVARARARQAAQGLLEPPARGFARLKELAADMTDPEYLQHLALEENPVGQRLLFKKARDTLLKKTRGNYPAPEKALEVVRIGIQEGLEAGYAAEADRFGQVAVSPEARALMSIFFAMNELKKDTGVDDPEVKPRSVKKVGILGGGLMGGGIGAVNVMNAGIPARIHEIDDAGVLRGLKYTRKLLDKEVKRRWRKSIDADRLMTMISGTLDYSGFESTDVVIEAVFEDLNLKHRILREVEEVVREDTIFASNTSSIPITKIAEASKRPETVIGMHYFSPVEKMPLLEIITTDKTAPWVTATCVALGKAQGKTVIVVGDGTGFYTSRILGPYMNEAGRVLLEGASIESIDDAMMDWGFPVGPITLLDEVGIDVAVKAGKVMHEAFGDRLQSPDTMGILTADNRLGRKNGRGFYKYESGKKVGVDPTIYDLLEDLRGSRLVPRNEIQQRLGLQMVNEAARCLEEGILRSPRDGDIGAIFGLGFPPFRGGPFSYMDSVGAAEIVRHLERFAEREGTRFTPAEILRDYAKSGKRFRA
ncbi:MAG: fatty acid oxidation complex subunit alpha FadJ [Myxococcota bacterium]